MHKIPNIEAYENDIKAGAAAFAAGRGICESPHAAGVRAVAWEIGWLNECQTWLHTIAGVQNKAGDMLQERIGFLTAEDEAAA